MGQVLSFTTRESTRDSRAAVISRPAPAFYADRHGRYSFVNQEWSRLTGIGQADAWGEGWLQSVHPCDRGEVVLHWREVVAHEGFCNLEYRILTPTQRLAWVVCQAMPQYDMDGILIGYGGVLCNVTAHRNSIEPLAANVSEHA